MVVVLREAPQGNLSCLTLTQPSKEKALCGKFVVDREIRYMHDPGSRSIALCWRDQAVSLMDQKVLFVLCARNK